MMSLTHLAISGLATATILGSSDAIVLGVGAVAGLLPDVDVGKSPAGRLLFPVSRFLEGRFPHRSCTHSLLASVVIGAGVYGMAYAGILNWQLAHAIEIGYSAGYVADLVTKSGVQLFFPAPVRCVVPGNRKFRLSTGDSIEYALLVLILVASILIINVNLRGGLAPAFNEILATPRGVQDLVNKKGGTHQIIVNIDGVRVQDRSRISGTYGVLEQKDAQTFLVYPLDRSQELYQVSSKPEGNNQILSERITAIVGNPIKTTVRSLRIREEEIAPKLLALQVDGDLVYISGSIEVEDADEIAIDIKPDRFPTLTKRGQKLELDHAILDEVIQTIGDRWGSGNLKVKTIVTLN
jgi:inner membrane protein